MKSIKQRLREQEISFYEEMAALEAEGFFDRLKAIASSPVQSSYTHPDPKINAYNEMQASLNKS